MRSLLPSGSLVDELDEKRSPVAVRGVGKRSVSHWKSFDPLDFSKC